MVGLDEEMMPGCGVECVKNKINTVVSVRFHFFLCLVNWTIFNRLLDAFLVALGVPWPWGAFCRLWGILGVAWNFDGFEDPAASSQGHRTEVFDG